MADSKFYSRTKTIGGKEYTAQFNGISVAAELTDESLDKNGNFNLQKSAKFVFERVIVDPPNLTMDDFESMESMAQVLVFGREVANGKFRDKPDKKAAK